VVLVARSGRNGLRTAKTASMKTVTIHSMTRIRHKMPEFRSGTNRDQECLIVGHPR